MTGFGISDLSRSFVLRGLNTDLSQSLVRLSEEVVSGRSSDTTLRLNGQFSFLTQIESDLIQTEARSTALSEVALLAESQQNALGRLVDGADTVFGTLALARNDAGTLDVDTLAAEARGLLDSMVSAINANVAGRYSFSGTQVDAPPLVSTDELLAELTTAISGVTSVPDLRIAADDFFNLPGGVFETNVYQGSTQSLSPINIGNGETVALNMRADDPAIRDILKSVALIAVAGEPGAPLPDDALRSMIIDQADEVLNARGGIIDLRAQLGFSEERIDRSTTRLEAERTSLQLARSDLIGVDPFETASSLEAVRAQLETLYSVTARTQNLSLVNFL
ncbi:MAG: flagellin [Pseudomonadota bacterium]